MRRNRVVRLPARSPRPARSQQPAQSPRARSRPAPSRQGPNRPRPSRRLQRRHQPSKPGALGTAFARSTPCTCLFFLLSSSPHRSQLHPDRMLRDVLLGRARRRCFLQIAISPGLHRHQQISSVVHRHDSSNRAPRISLFAMLRSETFLWLLLRQIESARRNGALSRGPVTDRGRDPLTAGKTMSGASLRGSKKFRKKRKNEPDSPAGESEGHAA